MMTSRSILAKTQLDLVKPGGISRGVMDRNSGVVSEKLFNPWNLGIANDVDFNRARLTSAAADTRDRVNDTNTRRSSLVRRKQISCRIYYYTTLTLRNKDNAQNGKNDSQPLLATDVLPQEKDRPDGNKNYIEAHKWIGKA